MIVKSRCFHKFGVTLIELLVATSMMAMVGTGVYRTFSSGITVWKWFVASRPKGEIAIFFNRIAFDARNYCDFSSSGFRGEQHKISFLVHDTRYQFLDKKSDLSSENQGNAINRVEYIFLPDKKEIHRRTYAFGSDAPQSDMTSLVDIEGLAFVFYASDAKEGGFIKSETLDGVTPKAIEVEITVPSSRAGMQVLRRIIELPIGI